MSVIPAAGETRTVTARDGRTLACLEVGDASGPLVLHNHGGPSSRLEPPERHDRVNDHRQSSQKERRARQRIPRGEHDVTQQDACPRESERDDRH